MRKRLSLLLAFILTIEVVFGGVGAVTAAAASTPDLAAKISAAPNSCSTEGVGLTPSFNLDFNQPMKLVILGGGITRIYLQDLTDPKGSMDSLPIQGDPAQPGTHFEVRFDNQKRLQYGHNYVLKMSAGAFETADGQNTPSEEAAYPFSTVKKAVQSYEPASNATGINPVQLKLKMRFNEDMVAGTGSIQVVKQSDNAVVETIPAAGNQVSVNGCDVVVALSQTLANDTTYWVKVDPNAFATKTGLPFDGIHSPGEWSFKTQPKTAIVSTYPRNNDVNVPAATKLTLTYNFPVTAGTGAIELRRTNGALIQSIPANHTLVTGSGTTQITMDFSNYMTGNSGYYVTVADDAFKDSQGNAVQGITSPNGWRFTTAVDSSSALTITSFSPYHQSTGVAVDSDLYVTFNREVVRGPGEVSVRKSGSSSNVPVDVSVNGREVRIRLQSGYTFDYDSTYYVTIGRNAFYDAQNDNNQYPGLTSGWTFQTPVTDRQPPVLQSSEMYNNTTIRLAYNKQLYADTWLQTSSFTVTVNDEKRKISYVSTSGNSVYITLETGVAVGQNVKVSYSGGSRPIQDLYKNQAATFSGRDVVNGMDTALPKPSSGYVSYSNLTLSFNQSLKSVSSFAYEQFTVKADDTAVDIKSISQSGQTVYLTLSSPVSDGQVVKVSYKPGNYPLQDSRGQNISAFTDFFVRNYQDTKPPVFQKAEGTDKKVTLTYNEPLSTTNIPMKSQFSVLVNGAPNYVSAVEVKNNQVILTQATSINKLSKVTISYVPGTSRLTDLNGNAAGYVNLEPVKIVENGASGEVKSISVQGDVVQITYYRTLLQTNVSSGLFQVYVDGLIRGVLQAVVNGNTVTLKLSSPVSSGQRVEVTYLTGANGVTDSDGNKMPAFNNLVAGEFTGDKADANRPDYLSLTEVKNFGISAFALSEAAAVPAANIQSRNNQTIKRIVVDSEKLINAYEYIASSRSGTHLTLIEAQSGSNGVSVSLSLSALESIYAKDKNAAIAVKAGESMMVLQLSRLDIAGIARSLNTSSSNVALNIAVEKLTGDSAAFMNGKISASAITKMAEPVDFYITAVHNNASSYSVDVQVDNEYWISNTSTSLVDKISVFRWDRGADKMTFVPSIVVNQGARKVFKAKIKGNYTVVIGVSYKYYTDVVSHWASKAIQALSGKLIIEGRTSNKFEPNKMITRAEFAEYVARGLGLSGDVQTSQRFYDITNTKENAFIGAAVKAGIIVGNKDGSFKPNNPITREEMAIMMMRAMNYAGYRATLAYTPETYLQKFADYKKIQVKDTVAKLLKEGIIQGVSEKSFQPKGNATRAQAAVMLQRMLEKIEYM
ncbi:SwmB domain-containing protein [Paenibacillus sp. FSL M7-1455]|uniref:Ig-like domain-containing protein n=1 Tax=Paenibacillus sp. FSL M7-1455 TaxID=2975316 RepID=UPI0030F8C7FA